MRASHRIILSLLLLGLGSLAAESRPAQGAAVPPKGSVVVQSPGHLWLSWPNVSSRPRIRVWYEKQPMVDETSPEGRYRLRVRPGVRYLWSYSDPSGKRAEWLDFSVTDLFEYRADGRPGTPGSKTTPATPGSPGGKIQARLSKDSSGTHLWIGEGEQQRHFFLNEPGRRFLLSARGGDGGAGYVGEDERVYEHEVPGRRSRPPARATAGGNGGDAGWGGRIELRTNLEDWQELLAIDLSPGSPGKGGRGGSYVGTDGDVLSSRVFHLPSGADGKPGQAGHLKVTRLP